jgi:hypothetical protein
MSCVMQETRAQQSLPPGARRLEHLNNELLPFWTTESAFGQPLGAFPTRRCNDRQLYNERKPCPEIEPPTNDISSRFPASHTAMVWLFILLAIAPIWI